MQVVLSENEISIYIRYRRVKTQETQLRPLQMALSLGTEQVLTASLEIPAYRKGSVHLSVPTSLIRVRGTFT